MNNFGFIKLRLACATGWVEVAEAVLEAVPYSEWQATFSATALDFGSIESSSSATRNITIINSGTGMLAVGNITIPAFPFTVAHDECSGRYIPAGQSCRVGVLFEPTAAGTFYSAVTIGTNDSAHALTTVSLGGSAVTPASIRGTVTDQNGQPLSGATVTLKLSAIQSNDLEYTCQGVALQHTDYQAVSQNDGNKYSCLGTAMFRVRNPYGIEPFTVFWNGIGVISNKTEYLAQRFAPKRTGKLTKVSFLAVLPESTVDGELHVLLKSALGGDRGSYIAKSASVSFAAIRQQSNGMIEFTFPEPPQVISGTIYYLEINGTFYNYTHFLGLPSVQIYQLSWNLSDTYTAGMAYQRRNGLWSSLASSLAFNTSVDGASDITTTATAGLTPMIGGNNSWVTVSTGVDQLNSVWNGANGSDGDLGFNGDDLTARNTIDQSLLSFYDEQQWLTVTMQSSSNFAGLFNGSPAPTYLVTDNFNLSFIRTLSATTDTNGAYSFSNLPSGTYSLIFEKIGYLSQTASGTLALSQNTTSSVQLLKALPASLKGTVRLATTGATLPGIVVSLTDPAGSKSMVTDQNGQYLINTVTDGP
jgi:hypothetical protein